MRTELDGAVIDLTTKRKSIACFVYFVRNISRGFDGPSMDSMTLSAEDSMALP